MRSIDLFVLPWLALALLGCPTKPSSAPAARDGPAGTATTVAAPAGTLPACKRSGCSGEVCSAEDVLTACAFRPEFACLKEAVCGRLPSGDCGFAMTPEIERCIAEARKKGTLEVQ
jgi:eight-cysteine-cluster-containing protein